MSNETLILKSAVSTNSAIKLTDCPMKQGEILEVVCRLFANGLTEGNRAIKALSADVKYNTEQVTEGALYCVSYRDGGFFVGKREEEDYEPKEGDWWLVLKSDIATITGDKTDIRKSTTLNTDELDLFLNFFVVSKGRFLTYANGTYKKNISDLFTRTCVEENAYSKISNATSLQKVQLGCVNLYSSTTNANNTKSLGAWGTSVYLNSYTGSKPNNVDNAPDWLEIGDTLQFLAFKQITPSDIIAYQATGKMGALFLGSVKEGNTTFDTSSETYKLFSSYSAVEIDNFLDKKMAFCVKNIDKEISYNVNFLDNNRSTLFRGEWKNYYTRYGKDTYISKYTIREIATSLGVIDIAKYIAVGAEYTMVAGTDDNKYYIFEVLKDNTEQIATLSLDLEDE